MLLLVYPGTTWWYIHDLELGIETPVAPRQRKLPEKFR